MTPAQRIALARAFAALQERIAAKPVLPMSAHPVVSRRNHSVTGQRRGYNRRTVNIAE